jgi:hypothetical protein
LALFEGINLGIPYLIPSSDFLIELSHISNFFWSPPFQIPNLKYSEWYCEEFSNVFVYFNSWEDLSNKIKSINYEEIKNNLKIISKKHHITQLEKWSKIFNISERDKND